MIERVLYDIAQILESGERSGGRVVHVLEVLRTLVRYEQSAVLEAHPGGAPRIFVVPGTPPALEAQLKETLIALLSRLTEERKHPPIPGALPHGLQLTVPLIGFDRVIGLIIVQRTDVSFDEHDLRGLSVVASMLAAYLNMVRVRAVEADRNRELEEARLAAEAAHRARDEFLALISHEMKTPLTSTLACIHLLGSTTDDYARDRAVEAIRRNVHAQTSLIDEMLELACTSTAELRLDMRPIDPAVAIRAVVDGQDLAAEERSIRIDCTLDTSIDELVVDPARFRQILSSLLGNAIKFTPHQGNVHIRLERAGRGVRIQISDNGKGIGAEHLAHVFERFNQEELVTTRKYGGLGAGLAIVKNLVERQGGSIRAESPGHGKGATFTVELPCAEDRRVPALDMLPLRGIRVLLVDDDEDVRFAFQAVLARHGAEVTAVVSAAEALVALARSRPDVLLSDVSMPGESGYQLMQKVVVLDATLPAAALTAHGRPEDKMSALAAGFRIHIEKPIDADALVEVVAALASGTSLEGLGRTSRLARQG